MEVGEDESSGRYFNGLCGVPFRGGAEDAHDFGKEALDGGEGAEGEFSFHGGDEVAKVVGAQSEVGNEAGVAGVDVAPKKEENGFPEVGKESAGNEFGRPMTSGFEGGTGEGF